MASIVDETEVTTSNGNLIQRLTLWVDFMYERMESPDPLNTQEMAGKVLEQYPNAHLMIGQLLPFRFRGKILKLVVKDLVTTCEIVPQIRLDILENSSSGTKPESGRLWPGTALTFAPIPGSVLKLTGALLEVEPETTKTNGASSLKSRIYRRFFSQK